jgi:ATP-dependent DNA helicase RecG
MNTDRGNLMSIKNLIGNKESQILEFKSKVSDSIGKDICAFANTNDGIILVGVSDWSKRKG